MKNKSFLPNNKPLLLFYEIIYNLAPPQDVSHPYGRVLPVLYSSSPEAFLGGAILYQYVVLYKQFLSQFMGGEPVCYLTQEIVCLGGYHAEPWD